MFKHNLTITINIKDKQRKELMQALNRKLAGEELICDNLTLSDNFYNKSLTES